MDTYDHLKPIKPIYSYVEAPQAPLGVQMLVNKGLLIGDEIFNTPDGILEVLADREAEMRSDLAKERFLARLIL